MSPVAGGRGLRCGRVSMASARNLVAEKGRLCGGGWVEK